MKAISFTKQALEKLKHKEETYRLVDLKTTGLSIEVRVIASYIETYYVEELILVNQLVGGSSPDKCIYIFIFDYIRYLKI